MANGTFGGGEGTEFSPYIVEDAADFETTLLSQDRYFKQSANIDMAGVAGLSPRGGGAIQRATDYDGSGFTVSNLTITTSNTHAGAFGYMFGSVKNVHFDNISVTNNSTSHGSTAGAILGRANNVYISGVSASGVVRNNGGGPTGGFVGDAFSGSTIENCYSACEVRGNGKSGGFVGDATKFSMYNCYATGDVYGLVGVGGFMPIETSEANRSVQNCYSSGAVHGTGDVGGFVGKQGIGTSIANCYSLAPYVRRTSGIATTFGAFIGSGASNYADNCYNLTTTEFRG